MAFMVFWFWMTKQLQCKVSGQTRLVLVDIYCRITIWNIHKMRLILILEEWYYSTLGMAVLGIKIIIIGALIGYHDSSVYNNPCGIRYFDISSENNWILIRGRLAEIKSCQLFALQNQVIQGNPFCKYIYTWRFLRWDERKGMGQ